MLLNCSQFLSNDICWGLTESVGSHILIFINNLHTSTFFRMGLFLFVILLMAIHCVTLWLYRASNKILLTTINKRFKRTKQAVPTRQAPSQHWMYQISSKSCADSTCAGSAPTQLKSKSARKYLIQYLALEHLKFNWVSWYLQFLMCLSRVEKLGQLAIHRQATAARFFWLLRIMFFVMPSCHPRLLFHFVPVAIPRVDRSLLPPDPICAVTGNLVFEFGSLKKATLQRSSGEKRKYILWGRGGEMLFKSL